MDLLNFHSHKEAFHETFALLTLDNLHSVMVSTKTSTFSICENASQGMHPIPHLEMPKNCNKCLEASLTKCGFFTTRCYFATSSR